MTEPKSEISVDLLQLAQAANEEHRQAREAAATMLFHAIRCGEILDQIRESLPFGSWVDWVDDHFDGSHFNATSYIRLARNKELVSHCQTIREALEYLSSLQISPELRTRKPYELRHPEWLKQEALAALRNGNEQRSVARHFGVNRSTLRNWAGLTGSPQYQRERRRRLSQQRAAVEREQRERALTKAARQKGGSVGECYSLVRRLAQAMENALAEIDDVDARTGMRSAFSDLYRVEDSIVRSLGVDMPSAGRWRRKLGGRLGGAYADIKETPDG